MRRASAVHHVPAVCPTFEDLMLPAGFTKSSRDIYDPEGDPHDKQRDAAFKKEAFKIALKDVTITCCVSQVSCLPVERFCDAEAPWAACSHASFWTC